MTPNNKYNLIRDHITLTKKEREDLWRNIVSVNEFCNPNLVSDDDIFDNEYISAGWLRSLTSFASVAMAVTVLFVVANQSLPGEILYALKTDISEPIQRFSTVDIDDKLLLEQKLITRRVQEAKELKSQGKLDEATAEKIETQISNQAKSVLAKTTDPSHDDEQSVQEITTATVMAETKGTAVGSIDAVKVLSGQAIELDESTGESKTSQNLDQVIKTEKAKIVTEDKKEVIVDPDDSTAKEVKRIETETTKEVIKVKTIESVSKIEVETLPKLKQGATQESVDLMISSSMLPPVEKDMSVDGIDEVVKYSEQQINETKRKLQQVTDNDTDNLLKAVEGAAATSALTKGLE